MISSEPKTAGDIFELNGAYQVEFLAPEGIPIATARFNKVGKQIMGEYEEPGSNLQQIQRIYSDGTNCGWQVTLGENGDEVFSFDLTMYHGDILLGGATGKFGASPVICRRIDESMFFVNLSNLGGETGVPQGEQRPGDPPGMNLIWDPSHVAPMVEKVKPYCREGKPVAFTGHVSSWLLVAVSWAVQPCTAILRIPEMKISQEMPSLPIGVPDQKGGLMFNIKSESEDRIYMEFVVDTSNGGTAHDYDATKLPHAVLPPIPAGKDIFITGDGPNLIPVAMGLGYAKVAKSVSFRYHEDPYYVCAISNDPARPVGFPEILTPSEIQATEKNMLSQMPAETPPPEVSITPNYSDGFPPSSGQLSERPLPNFEWPISHYELEGSYKVLMLDHMPGGTAQYNLEVPIAVARFKKENGVITGVYEEPGKDPVELQEIYCDGRNCGWVHSKMGRNSDELFKFVLTMHHGDILLGDTGGPKGPSPIACIQIS